jgi:hypothetical protein
MTDTLQDMDFLDIGGQFVRRPRDHPAMDRGGLSRWLISSTFSTVVSQLSAARIGRDEAGA